MPPAKKRHPPATIVPDTSVLVDGRLTVRIQEGELVGARILIPNAAIAELEFQANAGRESGFAGLDEIVKIQELKEGAQLVVEFVGERPTLDDIELAGAGEIDARIRQCALEARAKLLTSDRVQAHVARAVGLDVEWIRPERDPKEVEAEIEDLRLMGFFDANTMSVHLKQGVVPLAKRGRPGDMKLVRLSERPMELRELKTMRREIIEAARRDQDSFIEIERHGATVVQLGNMRIAIAQPPFADGMEITAVRPVTKLTIDDYALAPELAARLEQYERGVFVSGPPGSGKSTFAAAVAKWLSEKDVIVKTMESPRDLQVGDEITQYAPLEKDMELTADVLLLVRPDYVIYDEVRKTRDFEIFADMRLAGVGLVGVTHANRAIDAVQRLIGRVELGMIPQVVDTIVHIAKGKIHQVLELSFTVKVPAGMVEADLARPVIEVRDLLTKRVTHEIYTYGEQVVVMPLDAASGRAEGKPSAVGRFAAQGLRSALSRFLDFPFEVEVTGEGACTVYVPEKAVPIVIGKGGANVQSIERALGVKIDVRPMSSRAGWSAGGHDRGKPAGRFDPSRPLRREPDDDVGGRTPTRGSPPEPLSPQHAEITPELRKSKKNLVLLVDRNLAGQRADIVVEDEVLLSATIGSKGDVRISRGTDAGDAILDAVARGEIVRLRL